MEITKKLLNSNNFVGIATEKTAIVLHHTAGGHRPDLQINYWDNDSLGRVAAHYVIGGKSTTNNELLYDGDIFQAVEDKFYCFHLGIKGNNQRFDKCSIGIELCNYGFLVLSQKDNNYYNYVGKVVPKEQVVDLGYSFRGYRYYHKYTDKQIESLCLLIAKLSREHNIKLNKIFFDFNSALLSQSNIRGLYTHTNFIQSGKWDLSPQPNLISALNSL